VPQRARVLGQRAQARVAVGPVTARQPGLAIKPLHRRRRHRVLGQPSVGDKRAQDHRHRRQRMLAADLEQQRVLRVGELARFGRRCARCSQYHPQGNCSS